MWGFFPKFAKMRKFQTKHENCIYNYIYTAIDQVDLIN
jgi:hypothetical protein